MSKTRWLAARTGERPATGQRPAWIERTPNYRARAIGSPIPTGKLLAGNGREALVVRFTGEEEREPPAPIPIAEASVAPIRLPAVTAE